MEDILACAVDDWVHPALAVGIASRTGVKDREALTAMAMGLIVEAIVCGWLVPGSVDESGFTLWDMSPESAIRWIVERWHAWGESDLTPGAIAWLAATPEGERIGREVLRREGTEPWQR